MVSMLSVFYAVPVSLLLKYVKLREREGGREGERETERDRETGGGEKRKKRNTVTSKITYQSTFSPGDSAPVSPNDGM